MTRRTDRRAGSAAVAEPAGGRTHVVAVIVPEPADAVPLVEREAPGAEIAVVCLRSGTKEGRAALDRALTAAGSRGCRVLGGPRIVDVQGRDAVAALLAELREIDPERLHTLDPDPTHVSVDEATGVPGYDVPLAHTEAAAHALAAARARQTETGRPLYVDCLRAQATPGPGAASARRYPMPVNWLSAGFDGRLTAFLPTAAGVVRWHEQTPGGAWRGPEPVEGAGLAPGLLVIADPRGLPHLFGLRRTTRDDGGVDVEVVHAAQYRTGRPLTPWLPLGGPNARAWNKGREVGFPAAAFDTAGNLFVFVRNFGHSISWRRQSADGGWTDWQHLSGVKVADDLVAVTSAHGGVEVFARARDTEATVRWYPGPDGTFREDRGLPFAARPGTLAPAPEPGAVVYCDLHSGEAAVWRPGAPAPCPLGGSPGRPAAVRGVEIDGWLYSVLVAPGADGTCSVGAYPEGRPDAGVWWQDLGAPSYGAPTAAVSRSGRLTVATRIPGGRLLLARRQENRDGLVFDDWEPAGH
ncbi:hypothetical protein [Streptomyces sp. S.PB5]|uniref:hypothetical protein n=1 Tax=Streptomyces sp. S.PB5 TaxID=3020844 RepID=UPI0025B0A602|nr:hypothetical protein [Streptomyces sp. S.PB5]MDN3021495.1 hypothetical protein [Streptomyces sp. S.PB5]